ncbi:uncharacterized protein LOC114428847 [Parambassis ranga]|uniref:Uncharacterized protein LOC114428846 n=1 Tax=Parambassis ranga TaxID=210632 RepID=A0A6P7HCY7_9TELE|nr:uncharacterized protein LOC114428846 [Parambassis ranga]XP_028253381.1 uncharacterized protein LOC114428847 [Parambassis ranga]
MSIFLVLCVLATVSSCCADGNHSSTCNVVPKDQYIDFGSSIDIMCQTSCVNGKIYWTLNSSPINETLSVRVNSTHTLLSLRNFRQQKATVQCHSEDTKQILGGTIIKSIPKPTNISCLLHYGYQSSSNLLPPFLNCSWKHQDPPSLKVNYTVLCVSRSGSSRKTVHDAHDIQFIRSEGQYVFINQNFTVTVRAKTAAWETESKSYSFDPYHIFKLSRPKLEAVAASSSSVLVKWRKGFLPKTCHCQVKYSKVLSAVEGPPEWLLNKTLNCELKRMQM